MPPAMSYKMGLPGILPGKLYKTSQTRGSEIDVIYQNRVLRCSTVLIPLSLWLDGTVQEHPDSFENGYILIATPEEYFELRDTLPAHIELGRNLLVFFRLREEWNRFNPGSLGWSSASSRIALDQDPPLGGQYISRVPDTTREGDTRIFEGFTSPSTGGVGAGIRVFEYATSEMCKLTRYQLAYLAWNTSGMFEEACKELGSSIVERGREHVLNFCNEHNLDDTDMLTTIRVYKDGVTVCPLCQMPISANELISRVIQVEGREVPDLTVTSANLFHVEELRPGLFNHRTYNLGWGHHHCNAVARDAGIHKTLEWMIDILEYNGYDITPPED